MPRLILRKVGSSTPEFQGIINQMKDDGLEMPTRKLTSKPIDYGEEILVLLKQIRIGDNREPWIKGDAEVAVTFNFETGGETPVSHGKTLGTFKDVKSNSYLPVTDIVVLPKTKIQDHLTIRIDAIELDKPGYDRFKELLQLVNGVLQKVPIPSVGSIGTIIADLAGAMAGLVAALDDDDVILRGTFTYIVDEKTYGGHDFPPEKYLKTGYLMFQEDLNDTQLEELSLSTGKPKNKIMPTKIILQVINQKPPIKTMVRSKN